jgi:AraC-like DNA-binding protein
VDQPYLHGAHGSSEMVAWLVQGGSVTIQTVTGPLTANRGQWVILQAGENQRDFSNDASILSIRFQAAWADRRNIFVDGLPILFSSQDYPKLRQQALKLVKFVEGNFSPSKTLLLRAETSLPVYMRLQSLFINWLSTFIEASSAEGLTYTRFGRIDERVRCGLFLIDHLPLDQRFGKKEIAAALELSCSQLDRLFAKATGLTPQKYFEQRRINHARQALASAPSGVKEVAYGLGFRSVSHFSTWFRRVEGVSPQRYFRLQAAG